MKEVLLMKEVVVNEGGFCTYQVLIGTLLSYYNEVIVERLT